mmetsp:Transcript_2389/g.5914  ORF Transcript_2389/g.5914 Transcript_2389/m.5914 type:complete len:293 (-) Transcript_2389:1134-2012(-)
MQNGRLPSECANRFQFRGAAETTTFFDQGQRKDTMSERRHRRWEAHLLVQFDPRQQPALWHALRAATTMGGRMSAGTKAADVSMLPAFSACDHAINFAQTKVTRICRMAGSPPSAPIDFNFGAPLRPLHSSIKGKGKIRCPSVAIDAGKRICWCSLTPANNQRCGTHCAQRPRWAARCPPAQRLQLFLFYQRSLQPRCPSALVRFLQSRRRSPLRRKHTNGASFLSRQSHRVRPCCPYNNLTWRTSSRPHRACNRTSSFVFLCPNNMRHKRCVPSLEREKSRLLRLKQRWTA